MTNETHRRALEHFARCRADFAAAMVARDAIDDCNSIAWRLAHGTARQAAVAKANAEDHCYAVGAAMRPAR